MMSVVPLEELPDKLVYRIRMSNRTHVTEILEFHGARDYA